MSTLDPEQWEALSPYLDRALGLSGDDRANWLASVRSEDPVLASQLQTLLDEHQLLAEERFLERAPVALGDHIALAGRAVGSYTLRKPIGQGGMATVWLAERNDGRFQRRAAVKFLSIALVGRGEERFKREGRILASLLHPHIAQLIDAGISTSGQPFLILEYVDGEPIDAYCDRHALDVDARITLFLDVLSAVAHAHANLTVHRDIKPSNVLVTTDGQVKLLDFGIAKLLDDEERSGEATVLTRESGRAMTPAYAAPEQITNGTVTTATDVYALGALLFVLLTGRHPAAESLASPAELVKAVVETEAPRASDSVSRQAASPDRLRRLLRGDLDTIIRKALKKNPADRYFSVPAFADDLRRYLRHEPITARPDTIAYRTSKFVRRNWLPVAAAALILASLSAGLYMANRERVIAERRFVQVRQLANKLFDIDVQVRQLPGNARARQLIVDTALEYLDRLAGEARGDTELSLDVGTAYMRVARVQGVPISTNLGQLDRAEQTLRTAETFIGSVLAAQPGNRTAFLRSAQIAHDRMILAGLRRPDDRALPFARQSAQWLDKYLETGNVEASDAEQVLISLNNVGNRFRIEQQFDEALRLVRRGLEIAPAASDPNVHRQFGNLLIGMARIDRDRGALDDALRDYREAVHVLEPPAGSSNQVGRTESFALALTEEGKVLGASEVSLGRPEEAVASLERAFRIVDEIVHQDSRDADSRGRVSTAGQPLADLLWDSDPARALNVYDHVLRHLAEIKNNARFRRDEVRALAGSAYPLQRLGRPVEARERLDTAFIRLTELKLYPAEQIELGSESYDALSALADYEFANGNLRGAIEAYETLLQKISAAAPKPEDLLADAADLSRVYTSLAAVYRRAQRAELASDLDARREKLWAHWDKKLPGNPFVHLQLAKLGRS